MGQCSRLDQLCFRGVIAHDLYPRQAPQESETAFRFARLPWIQIMGNNSENKACQDRLGTVRINSI